MKYLILCYLCGFNLSPEEPIIPPVRTRTEMNDFKFPSKIKKTYSETDLKKLIRERNKKEEDDKNIA